MAKAITFLLILLISPAAYAVDYTVGGSNGWTTGVNYVTWASGQTFTTSDSLVFNFDPTHAVDEVSQADYQSCNGNNPISSSTSSPTTIDLTTVGTRYFICPRSNHCTRGQRLTVTVTSGTTPSPPTGTTPSPPSGTPPSPPSRTPPSPPAGTTPSPPAGGTPSPTVEDSPPAPSGAMSIVSGKNSLVIGFSLVLAAIFV